MEKQRIEKEGKKKYEHINVLIQNTIEHSLGLYSI